MVEKRRKNILHAWRAENIHNEKFDIAVGICSTAVLLVIMTTMLFV